MFLGTSQGQRSSLSTSVKTELFHREDYQGRSPENPLGTSQSLDYVSSVYNFVYFDEFESVELDKLDV